jgi:hypothetical protein
MVSINAFIEYMYLINAFIKIESISFNSTNKDKGVLKITKCQIQNNSIARNKLLEWRMK